jgi:polyhydroxyalkanoate synthase
MMEFTAKQLTEAQAKGLPSPAQPSFQMPAMSWPTGPMPGPIYADPAKIAQAQVDLWTQGLDLWSQALGGKPRDGALAAQADKDKRFAAPQWRDNPLFDMVRQSYLLIADRMLGSVDVLEGVEDRQRERLRFATRAFVDAMSPSNFALTIPLVLQRTLETAGENLLKGLEHMLRDLGKGQLTHTDPEAFEVGRNIADHARQGGQAHALYELIQYSPDHAEVLETPLIIFPPWINRFYILDLNPKKSFIRWAVEQGLTVFMVSWKSADESLVETTMDDYVLAQIDAIDTFASCSTSPRCTRSAIA